MVWGLFEIAISAVGVYNVLKGVYNIYKDAEHIKTEYKQQSNIIKTYKELQFNNNQSLTESQYVRKTDDFIVIK
jgi:hypothetical protein